MENKLLTAATLSLTLVAGSALAAGVHSSDDTGVSSSGSDTSVTGETGISSSASDSDTDMSSELDASTCGMLSFEELDTDGDGMVSQSEWDASMAGSADAGGQGTMGSDPMSENDTTGTEDPMGGGMWRDR